MRERLRKKRGRPATGRSSVMGVRLAPELRANVDKWAAEQPDKPSQTEAIRRLVELGLAGSWSIRQRSPESASKASVMAGQQIDNLAYFSTTPQDRQHAKPRLSKRPT